MRSIVPSLFILLALGSGCLQSEVTASLPAPLVRTSARNLQVAPGGERFGFVGGVVLSAEAPEGIGQGELGIVERVSGQIRKLGRGVPSWEGSFQFSPDGRFVAFLADFRFREGVGALMLTELPRGEIHTLARGSRSFQFTKDGGGLAYLDGSTLRTRELATGEERTLAEGVSSFLVSPSRRALLIRRTDGALLRADATGNARALSEGVSDYAFDATGERIAFLAKGKGLCTPGCIDPEATSFRLSPDGARVAWLSGKGATLRVRALGAGAVRDLGEAVREYRWSPDGKALASRGGTAFQVVTFPEGTVRLEEAGRKGFGYETYAFSGDGKRLAYLKPSADGSIDLYELNLSERDPSRLLARGVVGFQYGGDALLTRTGCTRGGRQCELVAVPWDGRPARAVLSDLWNFRISERGGRLLLSYARNEPDTADLGWVDLNAAHPSRGIDRGVLVGAKFLDPEGHYVAYLVADPAREGVYLAKLD